MWDWLASAKGEIALAGIAGSAVSVAMEWSGVGSGIRRLFIGGVTAYFLAPIGIPMFQWALGKITVQPEHAASVGGFIIGIGGVIIVEIILKAFRIRSAEIARRDEQA
ncbi:hypothetical protein [Ciceribacter sp. L1K22]|uniref:hypothetical protein n=1 Tax=Ciceribacter sp. L1K22 TaxID=2820275 RepID=UPI001ABECE92|nr:hypothetical protein [Ciceribacter sp. L1K22]MBO3760338.1 hypothetical protein [Ciceribacter sp. L1K22]